MIQYAKYLIQFFLILLFQVIILNNIFLNWWVVPAGFPVFVPYIYPLFILLLPFELPVWALLILGFVCGSVMDTFMNTPGMHAFALVLIAYLRTNVLLALLPRNIKEYKQESPSIKSLGWSSFMIYTTFLILIHHSVFYIIELWSLNNIGYLMLKILASVITTILLIAVYLLLFSQRVSQR
ncbi:MAG: rod shape-determining protein MreD [Chitinophagaceae bacterium]|nr:rod shape-determining protein MreD [Chitinophagaceae bacterium]